MDKKQFGINLSPEERQFIMEYGNSLDFSMSDAEKFEQYDKLKLILEKLTPEEITKFNKIIDSAMMQDLKQKTDISFEDVVKNAINSGITTEHVEQMDRVENTLSNEKNKEGVTKDE